nr:hypothetical protein GCM10025732_15670 [Glycomyces mayteni]
MAPKLTEFVKAYDVRGLVGSQLTPEVMEAIGAAAVAVTGEKTWAVGHDMRDSGPSFAEAFARGATRAGADVLDAGLCSTDMLYFIAGLRNVAGAMFTASHNPAEYNGLKMCLPAARPIGLDTGLADIRDRAQAILDGEPAPEAEQPGTVAHEEFLTAYAEYMRDLVDLSGIRPLKVVVDAGNGMGGHTVPAVLGDQLLAALPLDIDPLYFELDGTFPNHEANPSNRRTSWTSRPASRRPAPTSASRSTATPTAASSWTPTASPSPPPRSPRSSPPANSPSTPAPRSATT